MDIATVVRQAAKNARVSRAELAVAAGVSTTTMARRLIGPGSPFFVHELAGIAGLLGLTVYELARRAEDRAAERLLLDPAPPMIAAADLAEGLGA